ncbi:MAG: AMP-binding protein [Alphaproteobacteria bacterium]
MNALAPFRRGGNHPPRVEVERRPDGSILLRNPYPLVTPPENLIAPFRRWAAEAPDRIWLAERTGPGPGWRTVTYGEALELISRIAEGLLARGLGHASGGHAPLMILSGNSIDHALMTYGAILAGCPVAPVSRSYSTQSSDFAKLRYVVDLVKPRAIYADDMPVYEKALAALDLTGIKLFHSRRPHSAGSTAIAELIATPSGAAAREAYDRLAFDDVAKFLFTSGSTGMPKAAINTHRMMCTNAAMLRSMLADPANEPPAVTLTWLPWNHSFGGNSVLNGTTSWGGTIYLDGGAPTLQGFAETLRNLREVSPTTYSNVPAAWAMLTPELERDPVLAATFFRDLKQLAYGGAALSQDLGDRIQAVAARAVGHRLPFSSGYGATETAPTICNVHWATERMGLIGLPLPGIVLKLVPVGAKLDVRVKGDCVTPGYFGRPDLTAKAFDEEGFYQLGDAAKFVDPDDPSKGLVFDGRVVEDFKLDTGTFVNAGRLRIQAIEAADGLIQDALVAGIDRSYAAILAWPNVAACRAFVGEDLSVAEIVADQRILARIGEGLARHNADHPGSSTQIRRALLMTEPPSLDAGETTDKGYVNQSLSLERRADLVKRLYADPPGAEVVVA